MKMELRLTVFVFCGFLSTTASETYEFPSGEKFTLVDESTLPDASLYADVKNTGSLLLDSQETSITLEKRLGKNVPVSSFMSKASGARYLRAHPGFITCLQEVIMKLRQQDIRVEILKGFVRSSESTGSTEDQYMQSGCGAQLGIRSDSSGTVTDIASTVFKVCPKIVEREMRDLSVKMMSDKVHFHMAGPEPTGPVFSDETGTISDPQAQAQTWTNDGLEPVANVDCSNFSSVASGEHYPARFTHERVLGNIDVKIYRNMTEFKRLVQYQGTNIEFENSESSASWCGESGNQCATTCAHALQGSTLNERCADRVMSSRMLSVLNKLQKKARTGLSDKLKVLEAWDEPYDGHNEGDSATDPLHYEGRAAKVTLSSGDSTRLVQLSKYAICAGADYVEHKGSYLYIGAKKYLTGGSKVLFPNMELLEVEVPNAVEDAYKLPSAYSEKEKRVYPLFDGSGRGLDASLSPGVTVGQFVSKNYRYFRLNPRLHDCFVDIVYHENKRLKATGQKVEIEVTRGFLSNYENNRKFDAVHDKRINKHNLGVAMQIKYKDTQNLPASYTPYRLFKTAIDKCAPRFYLANKAMGIGLYADSVFVDIRTKFHMMKESLENLPDGADQDTFEDEVRQRFYLARGNKIVDPENVTNACVLQTAPKPQSLYFVHEHSEIVKRKRRRKRADDDKSCVPKSDTKFCTSTEPFRKKVIEDITGMLDRKFYGGNINKTNILTALNGCFGGCGTCLEGEFYDSKTEHCNNFLHWVDWTLLNNKPDVTNFFVRSNRDATIHACDGGNDCIENSPLFSLVAPSVETIYRPDPKKSVEHELYSVANNPSPVLKLLEDIYAIQAFGIVKFWVRDDTEMTALKRQLEVVMLYNKNVTLIQIHVDRYNIARDAVKSVVEQASKSMVNNGCPDVSRETLTPYEILEVPSAKKKRAAEPASLRYQIRDYHKNFEARWANRHMLL